MKEIIRKCKNNFGANYVFRNRANQEWIYYYLIHDKEKGVGIKLGVILSDNQLFYEFGLLPSTEKWTDRFLVELEDWEYYRIVKMAHKQEVFKSEVLKILEGQENERNNKSSNEGA